MSPRRPDMPPLRREALHGDPIEQFAEWYKRARAEAPLPEAMTLATADADGSPDARMVLLKGFSQAGFSFYTNRDSTKGRQLAGNPRAALVIYWRELDRQVRVRGPVEEIGDAESDEYFATRPRDSQLGAWASPQSQRIPSREDLDRRVAEVAGNFAEGDVTRPPYWGGYLLRPQLVEFWQGQFHRLHDRFLYLRESGGWRIERLAP